MSVRNKQRGNKEMQKKMKRKISLEDLYLLGDDDKGYEGQSASRGEHWKPTLATMGNVFCRKGRHDISKTINRSIGGVRWTQSGESGSSILEREVR